MARILTYEQDTTPEENSILLGSSSENNLATTNFKIRDVYNLFSTMSGEIFITEYDIEDNASLYDYHGGVYADGVWIITRYLKTDITNITTTSKVQNPSLELNTAWTQRQTLTYI